MTWIRHRLSNDPRVTPAYRLVEELDDSWLVEYCTTLLILPKDQYERAGQRWSWFFDNGLVVVNTKAVRRS